MQEIEILAVDDASTDNSVEILKEYAEKYPGKCKYITLPENRRPGGARNAALRVAAGEYVLFVDSDDWIDLDACATLYHAANGADLCGGDYYINTDTEEKTVQLHYESTPDLHAETYLSQNGMFVTRVYRRELLLGNDLFFPEKALYEDLVFNTLVAFYAKSVVKVDQAFYHYYQRPMSIIHSKNAPHQYDRIVASNLLFDTCVKRGLLERFEAAITWKYLYLTASNILYICMGAFDKPDRAVIKQVCRDLKSRLPRYKKTQAFRKLQDAPKLCLRVSMKSPRLAVFFYKRSFFEYYSILKNKLMSRRKKV